MRRLRTLTVVFLVVFALGVGSVAAAPMSVSSSLPFAWIRSAPSSYAPAVYTLYPSANATVETTGTNGYCWGPGWQQPTNAQGYNGYAGWRWPHH